MSETNQLDLKSDPAAIVAMRILCAPRALVWKVWSDPDHLAHWWGPNGFSITTHSFDMRPGGVWRFVMHGPDGRDYQNRITYEEVRPPERIVTRHGGGDDVEPVEFRTIVTLDDLGERTRLTFRMQFVSAEVRQKIIDAYGADKGLVQTLSRLEAHLEFVSGGRPMQKISPFLWFDNNAEEAVSFYTSTFKNAKVTSVRKGPDGKYFGGSFTIDGQEFMVLNGGPQFQFSAATSFFVSCEDQAEIDHLWDALSAGGKPNRCGWVTDKFGVTWQIVPKVFGELTSGPDAAASKRVFDAMLKMTKFDIAELKRAHAAL